MCKNKTKPGRNGYSYLMNEEEEEEAEDIMAFFVTLKLTHQPSY